MLDSGGGGGYGGTNWTGHDVPYMWAMLSGQQTDAHWQHVAGWRRTAELASQHVSTLKQYRDRLAEAWPPERSAAAQTYVAQLDYLIEHVQSTYDAATANYTAFSGATSGISTTRYEMEKIYKEYVENEQAIAQYQSDLADYEDKNPVEKLFSSKPSNPVSSSRQEELTWQARSRMYELSGTLIDARAQIKAPPAYQPPSPGRDGPEPTGGAGGVSPGLSNPPFIPPIVPTPIQESPRPIPAVPVPAGTPTGPTLVGTSPVGTLPGPGPGAVPTIPSTPAAPGTVWLPPGGVIGGAIPPTAPPRVIAPGGVIGGAPIATPGTAKPGVGGVAGMLSPRPMPPGGVIGGTPGVGVANPGAGAAPRRVNPAGGVIGQPNATGGQVGGRAGGMSGGIVGQPAGRLGGTSMPSGTAGRTPGAVTAVGQGWRAPGAMQGVGGSGGLSRRAAPGSGGLEPVAATGRAGQRAADEEPTQRWDPDNPWETDEGVPPVVLPPREPRRHDPGPAIGSGG